MTWKKSWHEIKHTLQRQLHEKFLVRGEIGSKVFLPSSSTSTEDDEHTAI